jgi:hypothetical protein
MANAVSVDNLKKALTQYKIQTDNKYDNKISKLENTITDIDLRSTIGAELDYGCFKRSSNMTITATSPLILDTIISGNMTIVNGGIHLTKGKNYLINVSVYNIPYSYGIYLYDMDRKVNLFTSVCGTTSFQYSPDRDCNVSIATGSSTSYSYEWSFGIIVNEINRTIILDPLNTKESHNVEFGCYCNLTGGVQAIAGGENLLKYLNKTNGNIVINNDFTITLKKGKTWEIDVTCPISGALGGYTIIKDTNNVVYSNGYTGATNGWKDSDAKTIISATTNDINIIVCLSSNCNVFLQCVNLIIHEIAQPVVTEYNQYHELSNPLTTTPLKYGRFHRSTDMTTNMTTPLLIDTIDEGNMTLSNGGIHLSGGVSYLIIPNLSTMGTENGLRMFDVDKKAIIFYQSVSGQVTGGILYTPISDVNISFVTGASSVISGQWNSITVLEYRNNPVNQYGGFESKVLFEGTINSGNCTLLDDITKYNFLYIETTASGANKIKVMYTMSTDNITFGDNRGYRIPRGYTSNAEVFIDFGFSNSKQLLIGYYNSPYTFYLTKITGIKGQLPTLLQGGIF